MLEIVLLFCLCKAIGKVIVEKGRVAIGYQVLAVVLWFAGEISMAMAYGIYMALSGANMDEVFDITAYLFAMCGAGMGGGLAYLIALMVKPVPDPMLDPAAFAAYSGEGQNMYNAYEETSNLSSAKYMQNYSPNR
jgi:hypothetical protein